MSLSNNADNWQQEAINVLNNNGSLLMPTETVWGLGGNALSLTVIDKIRQIKNRPAHKTFILLVANTTMLLNYVDDFSTEIEQFLKQTNRPTTVIYNQPKNLPKELIAKNNSIAIRIAGEQWLTNFITNFGKPIISTSANLSSEPTPATFQQVDPKIIQQVDFIVPIKQNDTTPKTSSQIITLNKEREIVFLRK